MKRISIIFVAILLFITSCKTKELEMSVVKVFNKVSKHETLKAKGSDKQYYINGVKDIFSYSNDSLIIVPEGENVFYLTNNDLEVLEVHDFKNKEFMLNPPILGVSFYNKELYFLDISFQLKKYNFKTKTIKKLQFKNRGNNTLDVYNDSTSVTTETNPEYPTYIIENSKPRKDDTKLLIGIKSKGESMMGVPIYADIGEYRGIENTKFEVAFVKIFNEKIYFSFKLLKSVFVYTLDGKFLYSKPILVDEEYYHSPELKYANGKRTLYYTEINSQPLRPFNGYLTQLYKTESGNDPSIICYNDKLEPVSRYLIKNDYKNGETYIRLYWFCNNRLYTAHGFVDGITIFK